MVYKEFEDILVEDFTSYANQNTSKNQIEDGVDTLKNILSDYRLGLDTDEDGKKYITIGGVFLALTSATQCVHSDLIDPVDDLQNLLSDVRDHLFPVNDILVLED